MLSVDIVEILLLWSNFNLAMPLIWLLRRILSDSILLPFLLLSVLFGITFKNKDTKIYDNLDYKIGLEKNHGNKILLSISPSGIFLGFDIFTKISAFAMIPQVAWKSQRPRFFSSCAGLEEIMI